MPACGIFYEGYLPGSAKLWNTAPRHDALWVLPAHTCFNPSILASQLDASFQSLSSSRRRTNGNTQRLIRVVRPPSVHAAILGINHEHHSREYKQIAPDMKTRVLQNWSVLGIFFFPLFENEHSPCKIALGEVNRANSACSPCGLMANYPTRTPVNAASTRTFGWSAWRDRPCEPRQRSAACFSWILPVCAAMKSDASSSFILAVLFAKRQVCWGGE